MLTNLNFDSRNEENSVVLCSEPEIGKWVPLRL